jgi:hypothetical protein
MHEEGEDGSFVKAYWKRKKKDFYSDEGVVEGR